MSIIAQLTSWNLQEHGPLFTIIGMLMAGIAWMFRTWIHTVKEHATTIKATNEKTIEGQLSLTNTYREDIKELSDNQIKANKEAIDKFVDLHNKAIQQREGK